MVNGIQVPTSPNFGPYVSPWAITGNTENPGEPSLTELAKSFVPMMGLSPLSQIFPDENILERVVYIQQSMSTVDTIFPLVEMGKPDVVLGHNYGTMRGMYVQPLYIRRSTFISYGEINSKVRPGTANQKWSPEEQIAEIVGGMIREHNLTWDVFRAMMLLGGIAYTDPRTGVGHTVNAQIPARNFFNYNVTAGHRGRNEANIFRTVTEFNDTENATVGVPWTHPNADIVNTVQKFVRWNKETNKCMVGAMFMSPELKEVLMDNNQIKLMMGGLLGMKDPNNRGIVNVDSDIVGRDALGLNRYSIGMSAEGLTAIAGVPIFTVETTYKDPVDGVNKRIWPKNKVVFVSNRDVNGGTIDVGRTQYCVSEESGGAPGLWSRTQTQTQIPAAPGMYMQMGNAGMPYLRLPYAVAHFNVGEVRDINTRLGILGDLHFGQF